MSLFRADGTQVCEAPGDLVRVGGPKEPLSAFLTLFLHAKGAFPWRHDTNGRQLWWSPEPRSVLLLTELRVGRSLQRVLNRGRFRITADTAFPEVVSACRRTRKASWITDDMEAVLGSLHRLGHAHSIEAWQEDQLVGGVYGVAVGQLFCGYSMFHREPNASKAALVALARRLQEWQFPLIDCHVQSPHMLRMGSRLVPREHFHKMVERLARAKRTVGPWTRFFP